MLTNITVLLLKLQLSTVPITLIRLHWIYIVKLMMPTYCHNTP